MSDARPDDLVTIKTYALAIYAEADRAHLEADGIPAFVADDNAISADYFIGNAIGYVKLQVPRSRAEEALKIVNLHKSERDAFSGDPAFEKVPPCLACGAFMSENDERCPTCGWTFAAEGEEELEEDAG